MTSNLPGEKKGALGIIGCEMFEDEIAEFIGRDKDMRTVILIRSEECEGILKKLRNLDLKADIQITDECELENLTKSPGFSVVIWMKPMALHQNPEKLREDALTSIKKMASVTNAILLFYGLCGNAFKKFERISSEFDLPVEIITNSRGEVVDDCIGAILGGSDEYLEMLKKSPGTFFLTPMWAANWRELFHKVRILPDPKDVEGARYIFKEVGYKKVIKMETGLGDPVSFEEQVKEFAELFNFTRENLNCTLKAIEYSYERAKNIF